MNIGSSTSLTPTLPIDLLSNGSIAGASQPEKIKAACKAIEGLFASTLMSEIGKGLDGTDSTSGQYQDFIQQALSTQVTAGGGFGLAKMLEKSLNPAHAAAHQLHVSTTPTTFR